MNYELDHVIVCCDPGAPEAEALIASGLAEGSSNTHTGQGTANRRFFFNNAYIELLWVADMAQARSEPAQRTRLWERWRRRKEGACPFGVALRPTAHDSDRPPPFPTWAYHAPYLPPQVSIGIALATPLAEPEFLYVAFATRPDAKNQEPMTHPSGLTTLTGARMAIPARTLQSAAARTAQASQWVTFYDAPKFVMELTFDHGGRDGSTDLRPALPLILRS